MLCLNVDAFCFSEVESMEGVRRMSEGITPPHRNAYIVNSTTGERSLRFLTDSRFDKGSFFSYELHPARSLL